MTWLRWSGQGVGRSGALWVLSDGAGSGGRGGGKGKDVTDVCLGCFRDFSKAPITWQCLGVDIPRN